MGAGQRHDQVSARHSFLFWNVAHGTEAAIWVMVELLKVFRDRMIPQNPWTAQPLALALLGVTGGTLFELELLPAARISFVAAFILAVALLHGWRTSAALAVVALVIGSLAGHAAGPSSLELIFAVASGAVLRSSASCMPAVALLLIPKLMLCAWAICFGVAPDPWLTTTVALTESMSNIALAIGCMVLLPRFEAHQPTRARVNTGHLMFLLIAGSAVFTVIGLLVMLQPSPLNSSIWPQVCVLLISALFIARAATLYAETLLQGVQRWILHDTAASPRLLPSSLEEGATRILRESDRLRRSLDDRCNELKAAARQIERLTRLVETSLRLLEQCLQRLRQSERTFQIVRTRYRILMHYCTDIALFVTGDGRIESASRSIVRLLGYDPAAVRGQPLTLLIPQGPGFEHPLGSMARAAASRVPLRTTLRTAAGRKVDTYVQICRYAQHDGDHYAIRVRDPTNEYPAATPSPRTQGHLEHARSRDLFIATMSHELRTPLHGLLATLEMMRTESQSSPELQRHLSVARLSARSLLKIANDILDLTRIDSGHFTLQHEVFSLQRLLQEAVESFSAQADSLRLNLSLQVADGLPPSFIGDPLRVKQIINNLVSNALKFTKRGGVDLSVMYDGRQITIDVIDSGDGVPVDKRDSIFDPFVRADSARCAHTGAGLGLPISRRLAQAMSGDLVLLRSSKEGSAFRLTLQLEASRQSPRDEQTQRIFRNPRGRILVIEDDSTNRFVAEALLTGLRCPVTLVDNGLEAIRLHSERQFDLILMDCRMPDMDGYETTRRLRALPQRRVPIIAMTASAMTEDRIRCLEAGMDDFLPKPFGRAALHDMLCKWLRRDSLRSDAAASAAHAMPDLDTKVFEELSRSVHHERTPLLRICESFVESAATLPALLNAGTGDVAAIKGRLHILLGSAGTVGARRVEHLARHLQTLLASGEDIDLASSAGAVEQAIADFQREFYRRLEQNALCETAQVARR